MSVIAFDQSDIPPQTMARVANLEIEIWKTKKTVKTLQADGHLTVDAEKHLNKLSSDLGRLLRGA